METLAEARRAHKEHDWARTYELFGGDQPSAELEADDLSALADAAWWLGKLAESAAARERAYDARSEAGDGPGAALEAFTLSLALGDKGDEALANGWRSRAYRLAEEEPGCVASGYLLSMEADGAFHSGDTDQCIDKARATIEIGKNNDDPTLVAWGRHLEGLGLIKRGDVDKGWSTIDESMVAIASAAVKPTWAGLMHCGMLLACEEFGDPRKAWQWVEATERWLGSVPGAVLYPGVCRIHKVHIMQLRGAWSDAEAEARRACDDLISVHVYTAARGYYEIAEIRRLTGDYDGAQELYKKAHQLGWDPQPGLAHLRLAQGRTDAALAGLRRALDEARDKLSRANLLPHQIEIGLAAGDIDTATRASDELSTLATDYRSPVMSAAASTGRGAVLLARGDAPEALGELRRAVEGWMKLDCLHETARARELAGRALRAVEDEDGAILELEAAREIFTKLGAGPDAKRVSEALGGKGEEAAGLSKREREVLALVAAGRSNKKIAAELFISENTVARHIQNIFVKLGVGSRTEAASVAHARGLT